MQTEMGAIERLLEWLLANVPQELLRQVLQARGYSYLNSQSTLPELAAVLDRFLHERDPIEAAQLIFSSDLLYGWVRDRNRGTAAEITSRLFADLLIPPFPSVHQLGPHGVKKFGIASTWDFVSRSEDMINNSLRQHNFEQVVTILKNAWSRLENLLKLMLIFYGKIYPDYHFFLDERDKSRNLDVFDVRGRALERCLTCLDVIEARFAKDSHWRRRCLQVCYRDTPFGGLNIEQIRDSRGYRNYLAHLESGIVIDNKLSSQARNSFIADTLAPVKRAVFEIYDENLAPWSMLLVSCGTDGYDRKMYGFMDEWTLFNDSAFLNVVAPTRWFYTSASTDHRLFDAFFFVPPPPEWRIDCGFWEPVLVPRNEVITEFERATALIGPLV